MKTTRSTLARIIAALCPLSLLVGPSLAGAAQNATGLRVGAARVEIASGGASPAVTKYAHEQFYIRAIVMDNGTTRAALVAGDVISFGQPAWEMASKQIAAELKCPVENIIMAGTHTHSIAGFGFGPPPGARPGAPPAGPGSPGFSPVPIDATVAKIMEAVRAAKGRLQPARMGFGTGAAYLNVNRDALDPEKRTWYEGPNLDGISDKTVAVVKFETPSGELIAGYVNYAMHPISMAMTGMLSADFAGAVARYIEQLNDDKAVVAFVQGASGDQNPRYLRPRSAAAPAGPPNFGGPAGGSKPDPKAVDIAARFVESEGQMLGEEVLRVMAASTTQSDVTIASAERIITCPGRRRTSSGPREGTAATFEDAAPINIRIGALRIGSAALSRINAEVYTGIGQNIKLKSPTRDVMLVTLANGEAGSGYIPTDAAFSTSTFQVLGSRLKPELNDGAVAGPFLVARRYHSG
jgi:neutral ceramidase